MIGSISLDLHQKIVAEARATALQEAADLCKYNSAEWDSTARCHKLAKWSLNIGCAHVGHAYESAILDLQLRQGT